MPQIHPRVLEEWENGGERITATRLGGLLGVHERQAQRICDAAALRPISGKGYEIWPAIKAVVQHFKNSAEAISFEVEKDKAATIRAERETAQLEAEEKKGTLIPVESFESMVDDYQIQLMDIVRRTEMPAKLRELLVEEMRRIEPQPPEEFREKPSINLDEY